MPGLRCVPPLSRLSVPACGCTCRVKPSPKRPPPWALCPAHAGHAGASCALHPFSMGHRCRAVPRTIMVMCLLGHDSASWPRRWVTYCPTCGPRDGGVDVAVLIYPPTLLFYNGGL